MDASLQPFLLSLIGTALQVMLLLMMMQVLGIQMTVFAALIGAFGVAAGLALSGTLQNFTGGIIILAMRPYNVGESIIAQGHEGTVTAIRIFYTVVTTYDHKTVIIPNSKLSNEVITNLSRQGRRRVDVELKLGYSVPFKTVQEIAYNTLKQQANILGLPASTIGVNTLENDGYKIIVNAWVSANEYDTAKRMLQQQLIDDLKNAGVKLPGMA